MKYDFSIITPSLNNIENLKLCHASIADQQEVSVQHIVMDGGSQDGTVAWLKTQKDITWFSQADNGMYNAINKGLDIAEGRVCAYLNCDEQYLPGTLTAVLKRFDSQPSPSLVFGDMIIIDPTGRLMSFRKSYPLRAQYIMASYLYIPSCTTFWSREIIDRGIRFDEQWKTRADTDFILKMLESNPQTYHIRKYLSAFTITGTNLGSSPLAANECHTALQNYPAWLRIFRVPLIVMRLMEKLLRGAYFQSAPLKYSVFVNGEPKRREFTAQKLSARWPL